MSIERDIMFGWKPGATRKKFANVKTVYLVGLETKFGWQVVTKTPASTDHYEFESISLARKWAREQINNSRFTRLVVYKKSKKGYTYMGQIRFTSEFAKPYNRWRFIWISTEGVASEINKDGTLRKL